MSPHDALIDSICDVSVAMALTSAPAGIAVLRLLMEAKSALAETASPDKLDQLQQRHDELAGVATSVHRRPGSVFQVR